MTGWNLPPGCNVSDLPGNDSEAEAWEQLDEDISSFFESEGMGIQEAYAFWQVSVLRHKAFKIVKELERWEKSI